MTSYGYILVDLCIISFNLNCIMQLKQFYNIATKVGSRKMCYYFWCGDLPDCYYSQTEELSHRGGGGGRHRYCQESVASDVHDHYFFENACFIFVPQRLNKLLINEPIDWNEIVSINVFELTCFPIKAHFVVAIISAKHVKVGQGENLCSICIYTRHEWWIIQQ